ncbi:GATA zinc finger domain-containing protein 14-like [Piliocolobus tephrosceles]|uniref:GATA zinc finger domain-containing protein 14-like n=1 Tax=Piliocolobus tephrosceles TaxID=591936 RepID=UPI000E6B0EED|nr:GATA zinc finger domain-containing protein 14-like [Piliocolobus tephrosceles]
MFPPPPPPPPPPLGLFPPKNINNSEEWNFRKKFNIKHDSNSSSKHNPIAVNNFNIHSVPTSVPNINNNIKKNTPTNTSDNIHTTGNYITKRHNKYYKHNLNENNQIENEKNEKNEKNKNEKHKNEKNKNEKNKNEKNKNEKNKNDNKHIEINDNDNSNNNHNHNQIHSHFNKHIHKQQNYIFKTTPIQPALPPPMSGKPNYLRPSTPTPTTTTNNTTTTTTISNKINHNTPFSYSPNINNNSNINLSCMSNFNTNINTNFQPNIYYNNNSKKNYNLINSYEYGNYPTMPPTLRPAPQHHQQHQSTQTPININLKKKYIFLSHNELLSQPQHNNNPNNNLNNNPNNNLNNNPNINYMYTDMPLHQDLNNKKLTFSPNIQHNYVSTIGPTPYSNQYFINPLLDSVSTKPSHNHLQPNEFNDDKHIFQTYKNSMEDNGMYRQFPPRNFVNEPNMNMWNKNTNVPMPNSMYDNNPANTTYPMIYDQYMDKMKYKDKTMIMNNPPVDKKQHNIIVTNIPKNLSSREIMETFRCMGNVLRADIMLTSKGEHSGCAYVTFPDFESASIAANRYDGGTFNNHKIKVFVE